MPPRTLRYVSPPKAYRVRNPTTPHKETVGRWQVFEELKPHPRPDYLRESVYEYHVILETTVTDRQDLSDALGSSWRLSTEIEHAWCYAAARPFRFMRLRVQELTGPDGCQVTIKISRKNSSVSRPVL